MKFIQFAFPFALGFMCGFGALLAKQGIDQNDQFIFYLGCVISILTFLEMLKWIRTIRQYRDKNL